jgi:catechol 2,3-dioxygenase-like lactoylglutathione lyase family enzyme
MMKTRFEGAEPILCVRDMATSLKYYVEVLGFTNAEWGGDDFTHVSRDNAGIYLSQGDQGQPGTWAWIGVESVTDLYKEYEASGASIRLMPSHRPWACEMIVEDPDGHMLRFGSEPLQEDDSSH